MTTAFRKHISLGIIWCLMVSSVGCYTQRIVQTPTECGDSEIFVTTKDETTYRLATFEVLNDGSISGEGFIVEYHEIPFKGIIQANDILQYSCEVIDKAGTTTMSVASIGVTAVIILLLINIVKRNESPDIPGF